MITKADGEVIGLDVSVLAWCETKEAAALWISTTLRSLRVDPGAGFGFEDQRQTRKRLWAFWRGE